jgi:stage V sporulation protein R
MSFLTPLPAELQEMEATILELARAEGLDFPEVRFVMLDFSQMNQVAAYDGFPSRYPHWRFGMEYERLRKSYAYGLHRIYEMVINTDPCYAYLLSSNLPIDQKLVMAHVYGHADFFKNNLWFAHTNRRMLDDTANHATRIRRYVDKFGLEEVETLIDRCLSLDNLIDLHGPGILRQPSRVEEKSHGDEQNTGRLPSDKEYMDAYINPPAYLESLRQQQKQEQQKEKKFPANPQRDLLLFLLDYAPLETWQQDVLSIVREEAYYFAPQRQTKIMNEGWACVVGDTLVNTNLGLLRMDELVHQRLPVWINDGDTAQRVYDWAIFTNHPTIRMTTRRGLLLEGSVTHRVRLADGAWKRLDELKLGDELALAGYRSQWPVALQPVPWENGASIQFPAFVDGDFAAFLGDWIGNGYISLSNREIGLTTDDDEQAERFATLAGRLFGLDPSIKRDGNRWRVRIVSQTLIERLLSPGLRQGPSTRQNAIPPLILRSPQAVVSAFLRAYFDGAGDADEQGISLSTSSEALGQQTQLLLLQFGILSHRRRQNDGCWHLQVAGASAECFANKIGYGLTRKQNALQKHLVDRQWFKTETWTDEVVALGSGSATVYDISVENTHCYAANGFINHNSYWHSHLMTRHALQPAELIDYADHHSGTLATSLGRLNPYKLGIELFRDIEDRWNRGAFGPEYDECNDQRARANWDRQLGQGLKKIFEVRRIYNDVGFIDEFLTHEFVREQKLFSYRYNPHGDHYEIESRQFEEVKRRLLFQLTNFGDPIIVVVDANYQNRGELYLLHQWEAIDLRWDYAQATLENLQALWQRPVHLETRVEGKGAVLLSFDGKQHINRLLQKS